MKINWLQKHQFCDSIDSDILSNVVVVKGWHPITTDGYVLAIVHDMTNKNEYPDISVLITQKNDVRVFKNLESVWPFATNAGFKVQKYDYFSAVQGL